MHVQVSTDDLVLKDGAYEDLSLAKCSVPAFGPSATFTGCDQNSLVTKEALHDVVVKNLSDQIRELKDVNARIIASTQDKDREIQRLRNAAAKGQPSVFGGYYKYMNLLGDDAAQYWFCEAIRPHYC